MDDLYELKIGSVKLAVICIVYRLVFKQQIWKFNFLVLYNHAIRFYDLLHCWCVSLMQLSGLG